MELLIVAICNFLAIFAMFIAHWYLRKVDRIHMDEIDRLRERVRRLETKT